MLKRSLFLTACSLIALFALSSFAQEEEVKHEYAQLQERKINYKDWTFKSLKDSTPVNLRQWSEGKKLVLIVYFAPWCKNWRYESATIAKLYEKYKPHGFDVVLINEYASKDEARKHFGETNVPYTVVVESETEDVQKKTSHYKYRKASRDERPWGSPFNVFLEPSAMNKEGQVVTEKAWVVAGELIEEEVDKFIRQKLGLPETEKQTIDAHG